MILTDYPETRDPTHFLRRLRKWVGHPANKTAQALQRLRKPITNIDDYKKLIDDLYFLFRESSGTRLGGHWPTSFADVNDLRTDLRHDVDHGDAKKVRSKRRKFGMIFKKYSGVGTPDTMAPEKFPLVQCNILDAIEGDLRGLLVEDL